MSYEAHNLLAAAAIRINALDGTDAVELQTTYATRPLTDANFVSSIFPMAAIIDSLVQYQGRVAQAIGKSADRVLRAYLRSTTDPLASSSELPSVDLNGAPIIGNFGAAYDADSGVELTRMPVALVRNRLLSPTIFLVPAYYFALDVGRFLHTRDEATLECCVWNADAQTAIYNNNEDFTLADSLVQLVIDGACGELFRDDEFNEQAALWRANAAVELAKIEPAQMEAQVV